MSADFAAVDWGTSSFRLWLMQADGAVLAQSRGPEGMQHCHGVGFAPVLASHLAKAGAPAGLPVLICGMAGARQGWAEVAYADLPALVADIAANALKLPGALLQGLGEERDVRILPGLAQNDPARPDVMRGEETQLLGLAQMGHQGLACIPGTHSKWAMLEDGAVTSMRSAMTGELFDILSKQSILRHGMPLQGRVSADDAAFLNAVDEMLADPAAALTSLFPLRAAGLLGFATPEAVQARLSGLLIGAEIGKMLAGHECGPIMLIGQEGLGALYRAALLRAGVSLRYADAEEASRQGLLAAARKIWSF